MNIIKFNNSILKYDGKWLETNNNIDPYNPLNLPPNTIRVKYQSGYAPTVGDSQTLVDSTNNIWDIYWATNEWEFMFMSKNILLEVLGANTTNVTNMRSMFYGCTSLTTMPLFDTSNVTRMDNMFRDCTSLTSVPLFDTSNVTRMPAMFCECTLLSSVPLFDTHNVETWDSMFYNCSSLTTVPLFNTSNATNMSMMLNRCTSLSSVPLFDTHNVTNISFMLFGCTSLTSIPLFDTSKVRDIKSMLQGCTNVQSGALALYQQASTQTYPPSSHKQTFRDCGSNTQTGAAELAQIPSDWK